MELRPLNVIADEIYKLKAQWPQGRISIPADAYLGPMRSLETTRDNYIEDTGYSVVAYFLSNATVWRGPDARRIKAELNAHLKKG